MYHYKTGSSNVARVYPNLLVQITMIRIIIINAMILVDLVPMFQHQL